MKQNTISIPQLFGSLFSSLGDFCFFGAALVLPLYLSPGPPHAVARQAPLLRAIYILRAGNSIFFWLHACLFTSLRTQNKARRRVSL
ncbi:hypothetical protein C8R47DRAFT_1139699 [Mycena vitilis]|nr:hypothetical protein C8R47DRAFT_1139699 [Mycena vitilis]